MDIFSKRDGPRPEDARAKRMISENAGTIRKLADQISNGGFTRMKQDEQRRKEGPKAEGLIIHDLKAPAKPDDPDPYIRISPNNRVVLADAKTGRQLQLLGEIRGSVFEKRFVLATKENGFFSPIGDDLLEAVGHLDNREICQSFTEDDLSEVLRDVLGLNST